MQNTIFWLPVVQFTSPYIIEILQIVPLIC